MNEPANLKQDLLRQAVADNVAVRDGRIRRPPPPEPEPAEPPPRAASPLRRPLLAAVLVVALSPLALWQLRTIDAGAPEPGAPGASVLAAPQPVPAAPEPATPEVVTASEPAPTFEAPRPIDAGVFPLAVERVVIDPGHGGEDFGTSDHDLAEKDLTLDIARRLAAMLRAEGLEVFLTRDDDRTLSLRERAEFANRQHADLFVSIHINWMQERRIRGVETYFLGHTEDPELNELARRENRSSGYSLADLKLLLEGIYTGVRQDESRRFAERIQRSLHASLRQVNPKLKNRGVKTAPFVVLVSTDMPAILAEVSCLSNAEEAKLLSRPLYREHIAEALSRGIRGYADDVHQTEEKGT